MPKWKLICHSKLQKKKQVLKNEAGVTLVELLASIAILGIIIALAGSVHIFGQRQFRSQTESANQANDISYALSVMSTDLRRHSSDEVNITETGVIEILDGTGAFVPTYMNSGNKLMQSGTVLIDYISSFSATKTSDGKGVHIIISINSTSPGVEAKDYQTTIYFRGAKPSENTESEDGGG